MLEEYPQSRSSYFRYVGAEYIWLTCLHRNEEKKLCILQFDESKGKSSKPLLKFAASVSKASLPFDFGFFLNLAECIKWLDLMNIEEAVGTHLNFSV